MTPRLKTPVRLFFGLVHILSPMALQAVLATCLRFWLTMFLGAVGLMKAVRMLRHPLSHSAGVIEAVGAGMQIPWCSLGFSDPKGGPSRSAQTNSVHGCYLFAVALGLILSTYKRRGPVRWSQLGLTVVYLILAFPQRWLRPVSMTLCLALVAALAGTQLQSSHGSVKSISWSLGHEPFYTSRSTREILWK